MEETDAVIPVKETPFTESGLEKEVPVPPSETVKTGGTNGEAAVPPAVQEGEARSEDPIPPTIESSPTVNEQLAGITERLDRLSGLFTERIRYTEHEEKIMDSMHRELQKYKEDIYARLLRPLLLDIIDIRESILRVSAFYLDKAEGEQAVPNDRFAGYAREMQDILEKNNVEVYRSAEGEAYTPVRQRIVKKISTDNKELHGKAAESLSYGYSYNNRTIFAEKVSVYIYEEPKEITRQEE
ncbi:MAG: nucleotide exchange factor GrpE [Treponema sp.]|jgi:molecular chaperone GrpE (heat shock protein)|nr:nucleotide exchange factor GrpE [Treponema sp.]